MPTAVVTGTDQGLGRAFVVELVRRGFRVFAGSHALAGGHEGPREISAAITELALDVTDPVLVKRLAEVVEDRAGALDPLVNNAAINPDKGVPLEELDFEVVKRVASIARRALDAPKKRSDASGFAVYDGTVHPW